MSKTTQCPRCAERGNDRSHNNLHEYPSAFHCFGCGYHKRKTDVNSIKRLLNSANIQDNAAKFDLQLSANLSAKALKWLYNYQLYDSEIANFKYDYSKELLILYYADEYYQGRNFNPDVKAKYVSHGIKPFILYGNDSNTIVLTEDIISAIKVGRQFTGSPMLGATPLKRTETYLKPFKNVCLWLDKDKAKESVKIARNLSERISKQVSVVVTEYDPKEYSNIEIKNIINNYIN